MSTWTNTEPRTASSRSMRERIEDVLTEADRIETTWVGAQCPLGDPSPKEWQEHDDARSALAQTAVEVLRDLLAAVDSGEGLVLGRPTPALVFLCDGRALRPGAAAPTGGHIGTRCPHCEAVDAGLYEVDRAERYNEISVQLGPARRERYGLRGHGEGWGRLGDEPNPHAGLPLLRVDYSVDRGHFDHDRYICRACSNSVSVDPWVQVEGF